MFFKFGNKKKKEEEELYQGEYLADGQMEEQAQEDFAEEEPDFSVEVKDCEYDILSSTAAAREVSKKIENEYGEDSVVTMQIFDDEEEELNICFSSIIGSRDYQQDSLEYFQREREFLGAVCDGMGGMSGGELASKLAIKVLMREFREHPYPLSNVPQFLYQTARKMDAAVVNLEDNAGNPIKGGTTVVAVYICQNMLHYMSVGDSKIYVIRDKKIVSITREHNYRLVLDQSLRENRISREEYEAELKRGEALISYLGMGNVRLIDVNQKPFMLREGDMVLLCSDGLYKSFSDREIENLLEIGGENFEQLATTLTEAAAKYGKKPLDNCSILLVKYQGEKA